MQLKLFLVLKSFFDVYRQYGLSDCTVTAATIRDSDGGRFGGGLVVTRGR